MKLKYYLLAFLSIVFLVWSSYDYLPVAAQTPVESNLVLVSANSQEAILELTTTGFKTESVENAGQTYQRLMIPGLQQTVTPGAPQVPVRGAMIGLSSSAGLSVEIIEADYETLNDYLLYPAPGLEQVESGLAQEFQEVFTLDNTIYSTNAFYPVQPVELGDVSMLRDQATVPVRLYPIQYNPVNREVRFYRRLRVRVSWDAAFGPQTTDPRGASPAYENLLRSLLLNYETLTRPPVVQSSLTSSVTQGAIGAAVLTETVKIGITEDGMYEVTPADLPAGFDLTGIDIDTLKLKNKGTEIPIYVHDDNSNHAFDGSDYFLFYGVAITDTYTTKNIYWLEADGANGQRMTIRSSPPGGATVPNEFPVTLHAEVDTHNELSLPGEQQDTWFWGTYFNPGESRNYSLTLKNISTTAPTPATVRVRLHGRTDPAANPDHHTRIYLNNGVIDQQFWDGRVAFEHEVTTVPHSNLIDGTNTIKVENVGDMGAVDQFYVNWLEIDYWDTYVAESNQLLFGAPSAGTYEFHVSNFTGTDIQVFDVTDPYDVVFLTNTATMSDGGGTQMVKFQDTAQADTRYLALRPVARKDPASIELDVPSSWKTPTNGADYIIITHEDFYASALALANHRSAVSALNVAVVKVGDIYDEFNYGIFNPQAIRDFLTYARTNWTNGPPPAYVLLLGGASYDYRDVLAPPLNRATYVPAKIIDTDRLTQVPSDNWYIQASESDVTPLMFIGRLPAQDSNEAAIMVDKIINYDQNPPDPSWNTKALFVADNEPQFETFSQQLINRLPPGYTGNKAYLGSSTVNQIKIDIVNFIDDGSLLVNYGGHGNVEYWAPEKIFTTDTIPTLNNNNKLPVVTIGDCLNGYFVGQNISLAEKFLQVDSKGAVAVWAATGLGLTSKHKLLIGSFYDEIFINDNLDLGIATTLAKLSIYLPNPMDTDIKETVETFVLFGDPAQRLGIPTDPFVIKTMPVDGAQFVPVDQNIDITFSKPISPPTINLSGPGTFGLTFTPTLTHGNRVVSYNHTDFTIGDTLLFTIDAQDTFGNPLVAGPVPTTWSFTVGIGRVYLPTIIRDSK